MISMIETLIEAKKFIAEICGIVKKTESEYTSMRTSAFIFLMVVYGVITALCICGVLFDEEAHIPLIVLAALMVFLAIRTCWMYFRKRKQVNINTDEGRW
ncbi:MAG: hypothetical protein IKT78_00375 [Ruminiclostridium sp.]|nr:hypothetical protein [Ruminiclostridium sp.]